MIRPECNQNCSYCYITQHGKELYPLEKRVDTETTLKHIDAFLKYIFDNKLFVRRWWLFAGDLFYDHLIYKIFDLFYKYYAPVADELFEQFHDIVEIVTPTNGFFFQYEEHQKKIEEYIKQLKITEFENEVEYNKISNNEIKRKIILDYYGEIDQWN